MYNVSKIDSSIVMIGNVTNKIFTFDSLFAQVSSSPGTSMTGRSFIFYYVSKMHYICHKKSHNHGRSYTDPPKWIKDKETKNPRNRND